MFKRVVKFCRTTVCAAPVFFLLNTLFLLAIVFLRLGMSYTFKYLTEMLVDTSGTVRRSHVLIPILLFFVCITLAGNSGNFTRMMKMLCTRKAKKIYSKRFLQKAYQSRQDDFYVKDFYDRYEYVKTHMEDTTQLSEVVFTDLLYAVMNTIVVSVSISVFSPLIFLYIAVISVCMSSVNIYAAKKRVSLNDSYVNKERSAAYYDKLFIDKGAAREIRIFHLKDHLLSLWKEKYDGVYYDKYHLETRLKTLSCLPGILQNVFSYLLLVSFAYGVYTGSLSLGEFVFLFNVMWALTGSLTSIITILSGTIFEKDKYVERYERFVAGEANVHEEQGNRAGAFSDLELGHVSYRYENQQRAAVEDVSLKIKRGEIVSILGDNGSGKTTLSKIICGLLENYDGDVWYNGESLKDIDRETYYKRFGVGFQEFARYSLTLRENIGIGSVEHMENEKMLQEAVDKGNLGELLNHLPRGIDTVLGKEYDENGRELSGGQWQRVILSRVYMGTPDILVLDEPTASIDPIAEMELLQHFREIIGGRTAILISHRIGFARLSDRICIMEDGRLTEQGTHEELLAARGKYYQLFSEQKKLYGEY